MGKYEIMYILRPDLDQDATKQSIGKINKLLTDNGGKVEATDEWGLKDLAYEIAKAKKGYYVVLKVTAENKTLDEFQRVANLDANMMRFLITTAHAEVVGRPVEKVVEKTAE